MILRKFFSVARKADAIQRFTMELSGVVVYNGQMQGAFRRGIGVTGNLQDARDINIRHAVCCTRRMGLCSAAASGQILADPSRLGSVISRFEPKKGETILHCEVDPIRPQLNFSLHFRAFLATSREYPPINFGVEDIESGACSKLFPKRTPLRFI